MTALKNEAEDYQMSCKIRAYVSAIESKPNLDQSQLEWIAWAKAKADWYDPTIEKVDPILENGITAIRINQRILVHDGGNVQS